MKKIDNRKEIWSHATDSEIAEMSFDEAIDMIKEEIDSLSKTCMAGTPWVRALQIVLDKVLSYESGAINCKTCMDCKYAEEEFIDDYMVRICTRNDMPVDDDDLACPYFHD